MPAVPLLRYIAQHPFSAIALGNLIGDSCYLGFAFYAPTFVSEAKLTGAGLAMLAQLVLLAYGDEQGRPVVTESGPASRLLGCLRGLAKKLVRILPASIEAKIRAKPVGISFSMLSMNGAGLFLDSILQHQQPTSAVQFLMSLAVAAGCSSFAIADFVESQVLADRLTRLAPAILTGATLISAILAIMTGNLFLTMSVIAFLTANLAGFYARIEKASPAGASTP